MRDSHAIATLSESESRHPLSPYRHVLLGLWILAFLAFHMAWTAHKTAAFTLNGFDLAEIIRVHPAILAETPPMRTSAFIWAAMPFIGGGVVWSALFYKNWRIRWFWSLVGLLIIFRVSPPAESFKTPNHLIHDDYLLTLLILTFAGVGGGVGLFLIGKRLPNYSWIGFSLALLSGILPLIGFNRAIALLRELSLDVTIGAGIVIYGLCLLFILGIVFWGKASGQPQANG